MVDGLEWSEGRPTLIIGLLNGSPIDAAEVGRLLIDLQSDYRETNNTSLVLARMETGSIWLYLWDAATYAAQAVSNATTLYEGGKRLLKFGKRVQSFIKHADGIEDTVAIAQQSFGDELKSFERIVEKLAKKNAGFEVIIDNASVGTGRQILVRMLPPQTKKVAKNLKRLKAGRRGGQMLRAEDPQIGYGAQKATYLDLRSSLEGLSGSASESDIRIIIEAFANLVKGYGTIQPLRDLALDMEAKGKFEIARIIREYIPPDKQHVKLTTS
ncbi:hypothetical protein [Mesorhizobium sp. M0006]|uniref:hypothetical protein n=1 Tax=unclassified Mesorhizobium TaxID=325217 RepID=UPI00333648EC